MNNKNIKIGNKNFDIKSHTYIMGILNVTPDSFSDGGKWNNIDRALKRTEEMIGEGADIIDIGGESTRPGYTAVSNEEEIARAEPVINEIKKRFDIPVSVDTYKSGTAKEAINSGADMINDIWGFKYDVQMAALASKYNVACCLMHNRDNTEYSDFIEDVKEELLQSIKIALNAGVAQDKIIIDPGVGFGKTYEHNLKIIAELEQLHCFGYPLLLGASRKSVIAKTLDLPVDERIEGTLVTTVMAVMKGCAFVRVHDILENKRAIKMAEAIISSVMASTT